MKTSESSIVEALSRIAETFSRLVVQHVQLLRSEVESEARAMGERGRAISTVIAKSIPFVLAGLVLASFGLAQLLGLLLEPALGRAATPCAFLLFGLCEAALAGFWMKRQLPPLLRPKNVSEPRIADGPKSEQAVTPSSERAPENRELPTITEQPPDSTSSPAQRSRKTEENLYGAVGRA
jgi:hypothetical protein